MISKEYAVALFELGNDLDKIESFSRELKSFVEIIDNNPDFMKLMTHPKLSTGEKKEMIDKIKTKDLDEDFIYFIYVLIDNGRFQELRDICDQYESLINVSSNIMVINAISSKELSKDEVKKITVVLEKKYHKTIKIIPSVDSSLLDGVRLEFEGKVLDTSYKATLNDLKSVLL